MKISTKKGDAGTTQLMFARTVSKSYVRVCAYGALDDFSATLGLARSYACGRLSAFLLDIQEDLVVLMTELATCKDDFPKLAEKKLRVLEENDLKKIEDKINAIEGETKSFMGWKHSGESHLQAALDMARARCRFAEREIVRLNETEGLARQFPLTYVNRLSDLLWLLAFCAAEEIEC